MVNGHFRQPLGRSKPHLDLVESAIARSIPRAEEKYVLVARLDRHFTDGRGQIGNGRNRKITSTALVGKLSQSQCRDRVISLSGGHEIDRDRAAAQRCDDCCLRPPGRDDNHRLPFARRARYAREIGVDRNQSEIPIRKSFLQGRNQVVSGWLPCLFETRDPRLQRLNIRKAFLVYLPETRQLAFQVRDAGGKLQKLYFFTTFTVPPEEILRAYGYRWNIETDLRSLKREVRLHMLDVRSSDMAAKELVLSVAAYNLTRAAMNAAGSALSLGPRQFSFSRAQDTLTPTCRCSPTPPTFANATNNRQRQQLMHEMLRVFSQSKLPPFQQANFLSPRNLAATLFVPQTQNIQPPSGG